MPEDFAICKLMEMPRPEIEEADESDFEDDED